jgi:hypothetical protein
MKRNVFISLHKPRQCDFLTTEKFQREANFSIPFRSNLQINFLQASESFGSLQDLKVILAACILWHTAGGDPKHNFK